jgi:hypothetical protein
MLLFSCEVLVSAFLLAANSVGKIQWLRGCGLNSSEVLSDQVTLASQGCEAVGSKAKCNQQWGRLLSL